MTFYVNWEDREVLSENDMRQAIDEKTEELMSDEEFIDDYCHYVGITSYEIISASIEEMDEIMNRIKQGARREAESWRFEKFDEYTLYDED